MQDAMRLVVVKSQMGEHYECINKDTKDCTKV